ncbi:hypothetical protein RYX36_014620 [Vicia faba]
MDQFNYQEFFDMILHWIIKTFVSVLQRVGILDVMDKNRERLLIVFFNGFVLHLDTLSGFWNRNSSPLRFSSGTTIHYWSYHVLQIVRSFLRNSSHVHFSQSF